MLVEVTRKICGSDGNHISESAEELSYLGRSYQQCPTLTSKSGRRGIDATFEQKCRKICAENKFKMCPKWVDDNAFLG